MSQDKHFICVPKSVEYFGDGTKIIEWYRGYVFGVDDVETYVKARFDALGLDYYYYNQNLCFNDVVDSTAKVIK